MICFFVYFSRTNVEKRASSERVTPYLWLVITQIKICISLIFVPQTMFESIYSRHVGTNVILHIYWLILDIDGAHDDVSFRFLFQDWVVVAHFAYAIDVRSGGGSGNEIDKFSLSVLTVFPLYFQNICQPFPAFGEHQILWVRYGLHFGW
jgi:hypothetical protein